MVQHCSTESSCGAAKFFSELPANTARLTVGFYNVGIQFTELSGKKWASKQRFLKADILKAFDTHVLDILYLCEFGELGVGIAAGRAGALPAPGARAFGSRSWLGGCRSATPGATPWEGGREAAPSVLVLAAASPLQLAKYTTTE